MGVNNPEIDDPESRVPSNWFRKDEEALESGARHQPLTNRLQRKSNRDYIILCSQKPPKLSRDLLSKAFINLVSRRLQAPHSFPMTSRLLRPAFRTLRGTPSRQFTTSSPNMTVHNIAS